MGSSLFEELKRQCENNIEDFRFEKLKKQTDISSVFINDGWIKIYYDDIEYECYVDSAIADMSEVDKALTYYNKDYDEGFKPLVHYRGFGELKDSYLELSEEFRLYYNLYEVYKSPYEKYYLYFNYSGDEEIVAKIEKSNVCVRLNFLKDYISVKEKSFFIYFRFSKFSGKTIKELGIRPIDEDYNSQEYFYNHLIEDYNVEDNKTRSWIRGKVLIRNIDNYKPYAVIEDKGKYADFIIDFDNNGEEKLFTCDNSKLSNSFGANPGNPRDITRVFFKREVLKKYYDNNHKYEVEDGVIRCKGGWSLKLDCGRSDYVTVFLFELGRSLPYKEQLYWRSYNIPPDGKSLSPAGYKRFIKGEYVDCIDALDFRLKMKLKEFNNKWFKKFNWPLFKPLSERDSYHWKLLHLLTSKNNYKEFDEQILALTKIFIESLNEKELVKGVELTKENPRSIDKLEAFLEQKAINGYLKEDIFYVTRFLRNLQKLRSSTVVHRYSSTRKDTQKVLSYFGLNKKEEELDKVLKNIFEDLIRMLDIIENLFDMEK